MQWQYFFATDLIMCGQGSFGGGGGGACGSGGCETGWRLLEAPLPVASVVVETVSDDLPSPRRLLCL